MINRNGFAAPGHGFGIILREDRILRRAPSDPLASHSAEPASAARTALATTWADPLDPTTKYFLNRWIDDYYSRRAATVETAWPRSLRFLTTTLANEAFRVEGENVAMLVAGAARDELQVERVTLRIHANPEAPHGAAADFDLVRLVNGAEVGRDRWTLSLQFTFLDTVDPELMIVNPMGILITYLRGDRALVTR